MFSNLIKSFSKNADSDLTNVKVVLLKDIIEKKFLFYILIGAFAASLDTGIFIFLHEWIGIEALMCQSISVPIAAIFSFLANAYLNFKKQDLLIPRFVSFSIVIGTGYLLGVLIIFAIDNVLQLGGTIGKLVSLPFVAVLQFYLNSKITFRG